MNQSDGVHRRRMTVSQVLARVERMLASGRISDEDAARVRAAAESGGLDEAVRAIRTKHMRATGGGG